MELKINEYQLPEKILFNYEELKQELQEKVSFYETLVYTDDQIKQAKADKATLNKLKKALNDERIRLEREYLEPFNDFKNKINEIIKIVDKPVAVIDKQIKSYEEQRKAEKIAKVKEYFNSLESKPEWLTFEQIAQDKWSNATTSMKFIQESILVIMTNIQESLDTLSKLPEFGFEATEVYKDTLDINKALNEGKRLAEIAKAKAEHEAKLQTEAEAQKKPYEKPVIEEAEPQKIPYEKPVVKQWVSFSALLSEDDALALREFFISRKIEFKRV